MGSHSLVAKKWLISSYMPLSKNQATHIIGSQTLDCLSACLAGGAVSIVSLFQVFATISKVRRNNKANLIIQ